MQTEALPCLPNNQRISYTRHGRINTSEAFLVVHRHGWIHTSISTKVPSENDQGKGGGGSTGGGGAP